MSRASIGSLRDRFAIEIPTPTPDGAGGFSIAWLASAHVWGAIRDVAGQETFSAGGLKGAVTHIVTLRPHPDLAPAHRLRFQDRVFHIVALRAESALADRVTCLCEERDL